MGKSGYMSLKLDMSKSYSWVKYNFLKNLMIISGFEIKLIRLIMPSINTMTFSIRINREQKCTIISSRGLRQGDPLSLYFFLFCSEGLISLLKIVKGNWDIARMKICKGAPSTNHLLFVMILWFSEKLTWWKIRMFNNF